MGQTQKELANKEGDVCVVLYPRLPLRPIPHAAHILFRFPSCRMLIIQLILLLVNCLSMAFDFRA